MMGFLNWRLGVLVLLAVLLVLQVAMGLLYTTTTDLDGRYFSGGQMQLSDGNIIDVSHSLRVVDGRFYAVTRQGDAIMETSGIVEHRVPHRYRLRVEKGEAHRLTSLDNQELEFDLLYGQNEGSVINLVRMEACLYGLETHQVYCPQLSAHSL